MNFKIMIATVSCLFFLGCSSLKKETPTPNKNLVLKENQIDNTLNKKQYLNLTDEKEVVYNPKNFDNKIVKEKEINGTKFIEVYDPLEPLNRRIYYFNYYLDKYLLIPAVNTYEFIAPTVVQKGVSNFFSNLQEVNTFVNSVLQLNATKATITLVRFGINSTVGLLGLFDVATALELPKIYEDFGLTLAKYGIGNGPYLVLPGFGPSNLRDTAGKAVGIATTSQINPYDSTIGFNTNDPAVTATSVINERKQKKNFRYYGTGSPFEYEYVRYFYTKYRETLIEVNDTK